MTAVGINTDIDASYNTFQRNTVMRAEIGFYDQQSGWQNTWADNTADAIRGSGFNVRSKDAPLSAPSMDTSTYKALVQCNRVTNSRAGHDGRRAQRVDVHEQLLQQDLPQLDLQRYWTSNLQRYWTQYQNSWNGSSAVPPPSPPQPPAGAC